MEGKNEMEKCDQQLKGSMVNVLVRCQKGCLAQKLGHHCWRLLYLSNGHRHRFKQSYLSL